jgi:hypothetical protein
MSKVEVTYTLIATLDNDHEFQLGKELSSPKMIVSSLKKQAYPPDFGSYKKLQFIKHTKTIVSENLDVDIKSLL